MESLGTIAYIEAATLGPYKVRSNPVLLLLCKLSLVSIFVKCRVQHVFVFHSL